MVPATATWAALDVQYHPDGATVAVVVFVGLEAPRPALERVSVEPTPAEGYVPGAFYLRELPYLERMLRSLPVVLEGVIVDGYVDLAPSGRPGLGAHLRTMLEAQPLHPAPDRPSRVPVVVGVAKTAFAAATHAHAVVRGDSAKPLWVTASGASAEAMAAGVQSMAGDFRLPALLRRVDRLARGHEAPVDPTFEPLFGVRPELPAADGVVRVYREAQLPRALEMAGPTAHPVRLAEAEARWWVGAPDGDLYAYARAPSWMEMPGPAKP